MCRFVRKGLHVLAFPEKSLYDTWQDIWFSGDRRLFWQAAATAFAAALGVMYPGMMSRYGQWIRWKIRCKETIPVIKRKDNDTMNIPKDPVMLLSYLNTQLRDFYPSLEELCQALDLEQEAVKASLEAIDYHYDPQRNQFC